MLESQEEHRSLSFLLDLGQEYKKVVEDSNEALVGNNLMSCVQHLYGILLVFRQLLIADRMKV